MSKRYSSIKKARSQSLVNDKKSNNDAQSLAKSNDNLADIETKTKNVSIVNGDLSARTKAPLADGDDLESITSSEFDSNSIFVTDATRLVKHKNLIDSNDQAKSHDMLKYSKKTDSSSNRSSILDLASRNVKESVEQRLIVQRDKSHTSLSAFRGTVDQDTEMNQMDVSLFFHT